MTDVEALLSVDAGHVPPGATAFFRKNAGARVLRARAVLAGLAGSVAVVVALAGGSRLVALLALLAAGLLALLATPTVRDGGDDGDDGVDGDGDGGRRAIPPQVMVVTAEGLIGRDERGLRRWRFEELATVFTGGHDERPHLVLVDRRGARHAIDHLRYHDGERLPELIDAGMRRGRR